MSDSLSRLKDHLRRGGAATLNHPAVYTVPDGALIAPARYAGRSGSEFVFETRAVNGEFVTTALVDSKGSQSNRSEEGLIAARREGGPAALIPTVAVRYPSRTLLDMESPHRIFDAHFRAGTDGDTLVVNTEWYQAIRDATAIDLSPLFTTSPVTLGFGGWDSSRKRGQLRLRSLFVSELFGVVAQERALTKRSGARLDPLGQSVAVTPDDFEALLERFGGEMSDKTLNKLNSEISKQRKRDPNAKISASALGFGGVPPALEAPYGVSVPEILRARTYSLAGLRRLRFGGSADEDAAARNALLAMLLLGAAHADADPVIRAYCDVSAPKGKVLLDDEPIDLDLSVDACTAHLAEAIEQLPDRLAWSGQMIEVEGDPSIDQGATADADDQES